MGTLLMDSARSSNGLNEVDSVENEVRSQVLCVLGRLFPRTKAVERRAHQRYPYPYLVHIMPVDASGSPRERERVTVVGKDLSERGLGFYHPMPIPHRHVVAVLESGNETSVAFMLDLTWCRFTRQGWYESGGRFLHAVVESTDDL